MRLYPSTKIYLDNSSIHGKGVFASQKILKDEIFEVTPYLDLEIPKKTTSAILMNYRFNWPQGTSDWDKQVVGCGLSSFYNHNNIPNANWRSNLENDTFEFFALRDIEQDEEIFVYYGGEEYWNDGRTNVEVK
jgi:SET domain-containing protein